MHSVVGLRREREVLTVALAAARHVVIEGPPGTGKSTLLRSIAGGTGRAVVFVEGNAELTPARLVGQHDPSQVLTEGYTPAAFVDGPLLAAMRGGALLYLEELNRVPEETLNVLITVLTEGEIAVPRLGTVRAGPEFRLIAAMNPFDAIGTARVSQAIADRMCRVVLGYQDEDAERAITAAVTGLGGPAAGTGPDAGGKPVGGAAGDTAADTGMGTHTAAGAGTGTNTAAGTGAGTGARVVALAVSLTRATRAHRDLRSGSSVRGAIDLALLVTGLAALRGVPPDDRDAMRDAAHAALSGRVRVTDGVDRTPESIIDELLADLWARDADADDPGGDDPGKADGLPEPPTAPGRPESRSSLRNDRKRGAARRTASRAELAAAHDAFADVSPQVGELDEDAVADLMARDPDAAAALLADLALATDERLRAAARRLAARVFVRLGSTRGRPSAGVRRLAPNRRADGDLDVDRTLDRWSGPWPPRPDELVTRHWTARRRAVCLLVDASGSMRGLAVALAAVAAAGVVLADDTGHGGRRLDPSVLTFNADVTVLQAQGTRRAPETLVGDLVAVRGHGTTDLAAALRRASAQLAAADADERVVLLLSDCLHTVGDDPALALGGIDRLHVLSPLPSDDAIAAGAALAARGRGVHVPVRAVREVAPALTRVLA